MSRALSFVFLGVNVAACAGDAAAPPPVAPPPTVAVAPPAAPAPAVHVAPKAPIALNEYFKTRKVRALSFSHDEKLVVTLSDVAGRPDLWVETLTGGAPTQVTHVQGFVHSFAFSPTADVLAFEADKGGDELPHLYFTSSKGETPRDALPDLPVGRRTQFVEWAKDGKTLLYLSNARDEKQLDLSEYDLKSGRSRLVWKSEGAFAWNGVSQDHRKVLISETKGDANNDLYVVDLAKPTVRKLITAHEGKALYDGTFTADGRAVLLTSDEAGEFRALYRVDLARGDRRVEHEESWDVDWAFDSLTGRYRLTSSNVDGAPRLSVVDLKSGKPVTLPPPPAGLAWDGMDFTRSDSRVLGFSRSERYLGVVARGDTAPPVPYVLDLETGSATPVAAVLPPTLAEHPMVSATSVRIPARDGRAIPALLYTPPGVGPFPAIIDVHGGPTSQSRREYSTIRQYLVSKGYVVLVPNVRGSTGYGKAWTRLNNHDLGGGPLRDVIDCKHYLVDQVHVDAERVVVMGGSYGGYMALAAATFAPEEFAANVDLFGVSDLKSLVLSFPPYWAAGSAEIYAKFGDPNNPADAAYQHDQSPLNFMDRVKRPLLVVQGENDARVKKDQSDRMVEGLRARHAPVHYLVLENEGHGFTATANTLRTFILVDHFLDHYVLGDERVAVE